MPNSTLRVQEIRLTAKKWDPMKLKKICVVKETINIEEAVHRMGKKEMLDI